MADYLLIESRDPFEVAGTLTDYETARELASAGESVTVYLVQNGVLPARPGARSEAFEALVASGVDVLADDFSLRERGIDATALLAGVRPVPIDHVVDRLAAGDRVIWL